MRELTGRKVFFITTGAFGVIIAVNLVMAYSAISTFPGVEVRNSYIASQGFDAARDRQEALGWDASVSHDPAQGMLRLALTDRATGLPAEVRRLEVLVGRATEARDDQRPAFDPIGGVWQAPATLTRGKWIVRIEAEAPDGTLFRQRRDIFVAG